MDADMINPTDMNKNTKTFLKNQNYAAEISFKG